MAATRKKAAKGKPAAKKAKPAAKAKPARVKAKPAAPPPPPPKPPSAKRELGDSSHEPATGGVPRAATIDHGAKIGEAWRRLEAFVASIGGPPLQLAGPATRKAIGEAEKALGLAFPADFRAALLLHDGQDAREPAFPWMPGAAPLYPVARIVESWKKLQKAIKPPPKKAKPEVIEPTARVKPGLARPGRIPIAEGAFLDLDPGPAGVAGQLLATLDGREPIVIDTSFGAALERWASVLERGLWVHDPARGTVLPRAAPMFQGNPAGLFSRR